MGHLSISDRSNKIYSAILQNYIKYVLLLFAFLLCTADVLLAQDTLRIYEQPSIAQGEIIRDEKRNRDVNGRLGGALLIQTDLTGLTFQANNGIIRRADRPGEYLLLLSPDERVVTVYKDGFKPFPIILSDVGINLESGQVWQIGITGDEDVQSIPITIVTDPDDASVSIDGELQEGATSSLPMRSGEHIVQIQRHGYAAVLDTIDVATDNTYFNYEMREVEPVDLAVNTTPDSATVYLNNVSLGTTPVDSSWSPGQYELILEKENYKNVKTGITIAENQENTFDVQMPDPNSATVLLDIYPTDAQLYLNDQPYSFDMPIYLSAGTWDVRITRDRYQDYTDTFDVQQQDTVSQTIRLNPTVGSLVAEVDPDFATMTLEEDGNVVESWQGDTTFANLQIGQYELSANALAESNPNGSEGYHSVLRDINITEGQQSQVDIVMLPTSGGRLTLQGVPGEADINLNGAGNSMSFEQLPVTETGLDYSRYTLEVRKNGFKPITHQFQLSSRSRTINMIDQFDPKSKAGSVIWSLFIPGGGQFHMGKTGRGFLFLLASGAAVGYTVKSILDFQTKVDQYETALQDYQNANENFDEAWNRVDNAYQEKEDFKQQIRYGIYAFAGVRLIELLDNLLFPSPSKKLEEARLNMESSGSSVTMQYNF